MMASILLKLDTVFASRFTAVQTCRGQPNKKRKITATKWRKIGNETQAG
jgi:hypothetical protein